MLSVHFSDLVKQLSSDLNQPNHDSFSQGDPTYPTCLSRCKDFTVGNAQFTPLDVTLDVRAGETHRYRVKIGFAAKCHLLWVMLICHSITNFVEFLHISQSKHRFSLSRRAPRPFVER